MNLCRLSTSCAGVFTAAVVAAFLFAPPAYAKTTVVGTGTAISCDETALRDAHSGLPPGSDNHRRSRG